MEHVLCHTSDSRNVDVVPRFMENVRTPDIYIYIYIYIIHFLYIIRAGQFGVRIPAKARYFSLLQNRPDQLWAPPSLLFNP